MCEKVRKRQKWLSLIWREKVLLHLAVNFIDEKITEEWNSSWSFFFWVFFGCSTEKYCKQIGIFFLLRHFFHSFFRLWQLVHIVPFRSSYQHHLKFHHRNPQTHLALCSSRGDCLIFLNRCFKVSVGLDFSYHVHLQHHQGFLSYNPQISF